MWCLETMQVMEKERLDEYLKRKEEVKKILERKVLQFIEELTDEILKEVK